jgi:hypothetical protein
MQFSICFVDSVAAIFSHSKLQYCILCKKTVFLKWVLLEKNQLVNVTLQFFLIKEVFSGSHSNIHYNYEPR